MPLGDASTSGWQALHETLDAVGQKERLATLVATPLLQAWEGDLGEIDLLHESSVEGAQGVLGAGHIPTGPDDDDDAADADADDTDEEAPSGAP